MINKGCGKRHGGSFSTVAWFMLVACLAVTAAPAFAEEGISVYCYKGDRSPGTVLVFEIARAAAACNELYFDCRGGCVACFDDSDYIDYVCIDAYGNTFLR